MDLAILQEPKEFRCLTTSDSQRMTNYLLQAVFKILSLLERIKENNAEVETKAHDDELHKDVEFISLGENMGRKQNHLSKGLYKLQCKSKIPKRLFHHPYNSAA